MKIFFNEEELEIEDGTRVIDFIKFYAKTTRVAVFINDTQLLRAEYQNTILKEKDNIRVFKPLSGG